MSEPKAIELICDDCGSNYIISISEREYFESRSWTLPKRCRRCRRIVREKKNRIAEEQESACWHQEKLKKQEVFNDRLKEWNVVSKDAIRPENNHVLYIIGNGFDLMHGVQSSYCSFRDSLGKNNRLRDILETYLTPEDIWADFEDALAQLNVGAMGSKELMHMWLENFDAYDEDASAADYFLAIDAATNPMNTLCTELPRRFRMWVECLKIGTDDRPLKSMFRNGKVLNFNYTEFVETMYGVEHENVCYIHGCRNNRKNGRKQKLILGHKPGANEDSFFIRNDTLSEAIDPYRRQMVEVAQSQALEFIADLDENFTKYSRKIIEQNKAFFDGLLEIQTIIVVGHSYSEVDWDYFKEVFFRLQGYKDVQWYFGCYGLQDLVNLEQMLVELKIDRKTVFLFRTDDIRVALLPKKVIHMNPTREKLFDISSDGKWKATNIENRLMISGVKDSVEPYEIEFASHVNKAFFAPNGDFFFAILYGIEPGVFLLKRKDRSWCFVNELMSIKNQRLLNKRLRKVFMDDRVITFVYNNRVRKYDLDSGMLIQNDALRNADTYVYSGVDVSIMFGTGKEY